MANEGQEGLYDQFGAPTGGGGPAPESEPIIQQVILKYASDRQSLQQLIQDLQQVDTIIAQATGERERPGAGGRGRGGGPGGLRELLGTEVIPTPGFLRGAMGQLLAAGGLGGGFFAVIRQFQQMREYILSMERDLVRIRAETGDNTLAIGEYRDRIREVADELGLTEDKAEQMLGGITRYFETEDIFGEGQLFRTIGTYREIYGIDEQTSVKMMRQLHHEMGIEMEFVTQTMDQLSGTASRAKVDIRDYMTAVLDLATAGRHLGITFGEASVLVEHFQHRVEQGQMAAQFAQEMTSTLSRLGLQGDIGLQAMMGQYIGRSAGMGEMGAAEGIMHFREVGMFERLRGIREWVGTQAAGGGTPAERRLMAEQLYSMFGMDWTQMVEFEKMSLEELRQLSIEAKAEENLARDRHIREDQYYGDTRAAWIETKAHHVRLEAAMVDLRETMSPWRQMGEALTRGRRDIMMGRGAFQPEEEIIGVEGALPMGPSQRRRMADLRAQEIAEEHFVRGEEIETEINRMLRVMAMSTVGSEAMARRGINIGDLVMDFNISTPTQIRTAETLQEAVAGYVRSPKFLTELVEVIREYERELEHAQ